MADTSNIRARVAAHLTNHAHDQADNAGVLSTLLGHYQCVTGTIHRLDPNDGLLHLVAQRGIPDAIMDRVRIIPVGKGMAGLAAERLKPVQVCNLQTDTSGDAKPGAKLTEMKGSIAVPMIVDDRLVGVLGVAKPEEYQFTDDQIAELETIATDIGSKLAKE